MGLMAFMEIMGTSNIAIVAAFFIGLMTALSPCPLATNISAIAYMSKKINHSKHTLIVSFFYTFGRMFSYTLIASLIVWFGLSIQTISFFLQKYGERLLGPLLLIIGLFMIGFINLSFFKGSCGLHKFMKKFAKRGYLGSFLLGVLFALAFCPFSAVLFFGMLIPLALRAGDALIIPSVFAFATGLPVIICSFILVYGVSKISNILNKVQTFDKWMRRIVGVIFISIGIYYIFLLL